MPPVLWKLPEANAGMAVTAIKPMANKPAVRDFICISSYENNSRGLDCAVHPKGNAAVTLIFAYAAKL
jgi:hypothetical protein